MRRPTLEGLRPQRSAPRVGAPRLLGILLVLLAAVNAHAVVPHAERITAENAAALQVGGTDAVGGIGDWAFGNGSLCAVVSDPAHESLLSPQGGVLVDLGHCGRADDQWNVLQPLLNMSREQILPVTHVEAERDDEHGIVGIVTRGGQRGIQLETHYRLDREHPTALRVETRVTRVASQPEDAERAFLFADVAIHGRRQLAPFTLRLGDPLSVVEPAGSVGFHHPPVDVDDILAMVRAILPANLHVLVGDDASEPGIAYGLRIRGAWIVEPDGSRIPIPHLAINGESFSMLGVFARPFWIGGGGSVGLLELAQTLFMDVKPGRTLVFDREIVVGARADVASVTDQLWPDAPQVRGRVDPSARIHVRTRAGTPVTEARPEKSGAFAFRLAEGSYTLRIPASADRSIEREIEVGPEDLDLGTLPHAAAARIRLPRGHPMRLVFRREGDGASPRIGDDLLDFRIGDEHFAGAMQADQVSLAGVETDPKQVALPAGSYRVFATRGPEFSVTQAALTAEPGSVAELEIEPPVRVLSQPGWLSADLHVHAARSDDSSLPLERRIAAFRAAGADVIVSTEHDIVADYAPVIAELGLTGEIESIVGVEITSAAHVPPAPDTFGHANVYPIEYRPLEYRSGALDGEGRRLRDLIADVRALPGEHLVQLNHPRGAGTGVSDLNFFTHLSVAGEGFRPDLPLSAWPNRVLLEAGPGGRWRDLDFDAIELLNGSKMERYVHVRADWYALLLQGEFRPGLANSDSHIAAEVIALPRNYVRLDREPDEPFDDQAFVRAVRAGQTYGTTGPLLDVTLQTPEGPRAGPGQLVAGRAATLAIRVQAAPWVPVSAIRVYQNGEEIRSDATSGGAEHAYPLRFEADAFVTVEVEGVPGPIYRAVAPGFRPLAFTNPIFVDADGDGRFTAPGLPEEPLPVLAPPRP